MAKGVTIRVQGLKELREKFKRWPDNMKNLLDGELHTGANDFVNKAVEDAPVDEGILKNGITAVRKSDLEYEVVSAAPYSAYVEFGTRRRVQIPDDLRAYAAQFKGSGGSGEGFFEHILGWVKRKGIRYDSAQTTKSGKPKKLTIEQTAYIIYHYLLINGVRPHPYFFRQREPVKAEMIKNISPKIKRALK